MNLSARAHSGFRGRGEGEPGDTVRVCPADSDRPRHLRSPRLRFVLKARVLPNEVARYINDGVRGSIRLIVEDEERVHHGDHRLVGVGLARQEVQIRH